MKEKLLSMLKTLTNVRNTWLLMLGMFAGMAIYGYEVSIIPEMQAEASTDGVSALLLAKAIGGLALRVGGALLIALCAFLASTRTIAPTIVGVIGTLTLLATGYPHPAVLAFGLTVGCIVLNFRFLAQKGPRDPE